MAHARFETFFHDDLDERRTRLLTSAMLALTVSMAAGSMAWLSGKLGITAVTPPKDHYSVSLSLAEPLPPQSPPPAPAVASKGTTDDRPSTPEELVEPEPDVAPLEVAPLDLSVTPKRSSGVPSTGKTGGGGNGPIGIPAGPIGIGRCLVPPCIGTTPPIPPKRTPPPVADDPVQAPISSVMARAQYSPDPDQRALAKTSTGRTNRRNGRSTVSFCIDGKGHTFDIKTRRAFGDDPEVDRICRQTVAKWRFSPLLVGGRPRNSCTQVSFDIRFE